jgi:hypothetical protein
MKNTRASETTGRLRGGLDAQLASKQPEMPKTVVEVDFEWESQEGEITTRAKLDLATRLVFDIQPPADRPGHQSSEMEVIYMFGYPASVFRGDDGSYRVSKDEIPRLRPWLPAEVADALDDEVGPYDNLA